MRQQDNRLKPEGIGEMNTIYTGRNWRGFDQPEVEPAPSEWLPTGYDESVYDEIDALFYAGSLNGLDAGDVMSICIRLQNELEKAA
ncbi:hypothetical protein VSS37_06605 [Candidatus Thiothrix sp. Deng01]|uniref:Uncharacterized protein n=1 Tax=Candidatus Thiothrix phosphatis TaxID=3112415 RepID=A0ABU6CVT1_9GAMM|nr:hypothetical protein [Candidatus Thiothrix sp. Deng01]MEB4590642.1 hypothetical protein [Candidatus Thiothrix sp. Deng01]